MVDLMTLEPDTEHPHGISDAEFDSLFTTNRPIIFAYHGYPWLIHRLTYGVTITPTSTFAATRKRAPRPPVDMTVMNELDRYHLVIDVIDRVPGLGHTAAYLRQDIQDR